VIEATGKRIRKVAQDYVLVLVAWRTQKEDLTIPADRFFKISRVICSHEAGTIDASKVREIPHSLGAFLVREVKRLLI
jgi:hypothetical protein